MWGGFSTWYTDMKTKLLILVLALTGFHQIYPQYDKVLSLRRELEILSLKLTENNFPDSAPLKIYAGKLGDPDLTLPAENYSGDKEKRSYLSGLEELRKSFILFRDAVQAGFDIDSVRSLFNNMNTSYNSVFGRIIYDELIGEECIKIVLFTSSLSCECTNEMTAKNETQIRSLLRGRENADYVVVDLFRNYDLKEKYAVTFMPTVTVLDKNNLETGRFVRSETLPEGEIFK